MAHHKQPHTCLKDATKAAKDAANKLHSLESKITRKSEQSVSQKLPRLIETFGENVTELESAVKDIKRFQQGHKDIDFEETTVNTVFKRKTSFRVKKGSEKYDKRQEQATRDNIEDHDQGEAQSPKRQDEEYTDQDPKRKRTETNDSHRCKRLEMDMDAMRRRMTGLQDDLKAAKQDLENANKRNNPQRSGSMERETHGLKRQVSDLRRRLEVERSAKDETKAELDDALTRLSAVASSKLRDNNPNVVDLSDQNRPSKISEQLSELYDNEWTNAYDVLETNKNDKECCTALLKVLMDVYQECEKLATVGFYERVQQSIESPVETSNASNTSSFTKVQMSDYLKQQIKELRKYRAKYALKAINTTVAPRVHVEKLGTKEMQAYVKKCIDISWLMVVQDPPLVFSCGSGDTFDTVVFRSYTKRGSHVEFVVWPALLVNKGGSMLSKGIAQGCNKEPRTSHSTQF